MPSLKYSPLATDLFLYRFDGHSSVVLKVRLIQSFTKSVNPAADIRPHLKAQRVSVEAGR